MVEKQVEYVCVLSQYEAIKLSKLRVRQRAVYSSNSICVLTQEGRGVLSDSTFELVKRENLYNSFLFARVSRLSYKDGERNIFFKWLCIRKYYVKQENYFLYECTLL